MDNQFNIRDYFTKNYNLGNKPSVSTFKLSPLAIILLIASLGIMVAGASAGVGFIVLGVAVLLAVGFIFIGLPLIRIKQQQRVADEWQNNYNYRCQTWDAEFDKFYNERVAKINPKKCAILMLGLDLDPDVVNEEDRSAAELQQYPAAPFAIHTGKYDSYYRWGRDGKVRTDANQLTWFFFSQNQIYIYTIDFKLTNDVKKEECTKEFFYSDITSISVASSSVELNKSNGFGSGTEDFIVSEEFKLIVPGDSMSFAFTTNEAVSASIKGLKDLIRTKKNG